MDPYLLFIHHEPFPPSHICTCPHLIHSIEVCPCFHQHLDNLEMSMRRGQMKGCCTKLRSRGVDGRDQICMRRRGDQGLLWRVSMTIEEEKVNISQDHGGYEPLGYDFPLDHHTSDNMREKTCIIGTWTLVCLTWKGTFTRFIFTPSLYLIPHIRNSPYRHQDPPPPRRTLSNNPNLSPHYNTHFIISLGVEIRPSNHQSLDNLKMSVSTSK